MISLGDEEELALVVVEGNLAAAEAAAEAAVGVVADGVLAPPAPVPVLVVLMAVSEGKELVGWWAWGRAEGAIMAVWDCDCACDCDCD